MFHIPFDFYPLVKPLIFLLDPEVAHTVAVQGIKWRLIPVPKIPSDPVLKSKIGNKELPHPIGLGAGFDKQAAFIEQLFGLGFSSIEVGGVTPVPQPGNPKPRMFRIAESEAIINRFNLNSLGFDVIEKRIQKWNDRYGRRSPHRLLGVNIARGDHCNDDAEAYSEGLKKFAPHVGFATLNISCPNECNARELEGKDRLKTLLDRVKKTHDALPTKPLLFVKIAPDQTDEQAKNIADIVLNAGVDGLIVSNTTATRPASVTSPLAQERGGLSGKPLFDMSTKLLGTMYQLTGGKIPLIGSGGVFTGADAYAKIRAGASLVQVYTAMVFVGPYVVQHVLNELATLLKRDGFASVADAVGADFRK